MSYRTRCAVVHPETDEQKRALHDDLWRSTRDGTTVDMTSTYHLRFRYVWLLHGTDMPTDVDKMEAATQAQHVYLKQVFENKNTDIDNMLNIAPYKYQDLVANPNIKVYPYNQPVKKNTAHMIVHTLDHTKWNPECAVNVNTPTKLNAIHEYVDQHVVKLNVVDWITIIITAFYNDDGSDSGVLGASYTPYSMQASADTNAYNNFCMVQWFTIGSPSKPMDTGAYSMGKTVVHELGHVLGLLHTFDPEYQLLNGVVPQTRANYLFQWQDDLKTTYKNNVTHLALLRHRNYAFTAQEEALLKKVYNLPDGFTAAQLQKNVAEIAAMEADTVVYSEGCNFMDYSSDEMLVYFNAIQVSSMRQVIGTTQAAIYPSFKVGFGAEETQVLATNDTFVPETANTASTTNTDTLADNTILWLVMAIGCVVLLIIVLYFVYRRRKK